MNDKHDWIESLPPSSKDLLRKVEEAKAELLRKGPHSTVKEKIGLIPYETKLGIKKDLGLIKSSELNHFAMSMKHEGLRGNFVKGHNPWLKKVPFCRVFRDVGNKRGKRRTKEHKDREVSIAWALGRRSG